MDSHMLRLRQSSSCHASTSQSLAPTRALPAGSARRSSGRCFVYKEDAHGGSAHGPFETNFSYPAPSWPRLGSDALQDWRAYRAQLVAWEHAAGKAPPRAGLQRPPYPQLINASGSWAHAISQPEPGCLLLARQGNLQFFTQAVVLITSHDDAQGTIGYALNKPSPMTVSELDVSGAAGGFKAAFGNERLHIGGPVHLDHITLLHRFSGLSRSHKVCEGMFMGGLPDALKMVECGLAKPSQFRLVLGMAGWAPGQLEQEIDSGYWHVLAASPDLVLPPSPGQDQQRSSDPAQAATHMYRSIAKLALRGL